MPRLNWRIVVHNIAEAREQLERLEQLMADTPRPHEGTLQVQLEHAYHHLNVAWNARHAPITRYRKISARDFNAWSKFPRDVEMMAVPVEKTCTRQKSGAIRKTSR